MLATRAKRSNIKRNVGEVWLKPFRSLKVLNMGSRNTPTWLTKEHSNLGQSNSLLIMCIMPLQRRCFVYFGLMGYHNQLCTFHTLINLLVTNLFYSHAWHWMTEAARQDKNGQLQRVPWSVGSLAQWCYISVTQKSKAASLKHQSVFLNIPSQTDNFDVSKCWQSVFGLATDVRWSFLKRHECFAKSYQEPAVAETNRNHRSCFMRVHFSGPVSN